MNAVVSNFRAIAEFVDPATVMAVVKANAYGHGLIACADALVKGGAKYLGVAFVEEGIELRNAGISTPILVFGGIFGSQIALYLENDLDLTASSISKLRAIEKCAVFMNKEARVHLKIDTGMERIGVHHYSAKALFEATTYCPHCKIVGVFSHLATADDEDPNFMFLQRERFLGALNFYSERGIPCPPRHIANSAGLLKARSMHLDIVRPGIALYGIAPSDHLADVVPLKPAISLKSKVVYFKVVKKGSTVGYGQSWTAPRDCRVVTVPIGYGDGYSRALSNKGSALIRGKRYPIIGRVCMDQIMVNIGMDEAYNGDEVVLIGAQGNEKITVQNIAAEIGTISWEVLTSTNLRVPRQYVSR